MNHPAAVSWHDRARRPAIAVTLLLAVTIGALVPFDRFVEAAAAGHAALRVIVMALVTMIGVMAAPRAGLMFAAGEARARMAAGTAAAFLMALWVVVLDTWLFRAHLHPAYTAFLHHPLGERLAYFMLRAFNENVIYRLFLFSSLMALAARLTGRRPTLGTAIALATVVQAINIGANWVAFSTLPMGAMDVAYGALRYIVPGVVWALLYRRYDFFVAEVASVGCHIFLQPALTVLI